MPKPKPLNPLDLPEHRVLISGSRSMEHPDTAQAIHDVLMGILARCQAQGHEKRLVIVHGCATGVDTVAGWWWHREDQITCTKCRREQVPHLGVPTAHPLVFMDHYPAPWDRRGKTAGLIRNWQMLRDGQPDEVWAFTGRKLTRGTRHLVDSALEVGVLTHHVRVM